MSLFETTKLLMNSFCFLQYVTNLDSQFLFLTDEDAPNGRLIVVDIGEEDNANRIARRLDGDYPASELLAEDSNKVLSWVRSVDR